jgi:hypothetical protein
MRGIILDDIVAVELLKPTHPRVLAFRRRQQQRQAARLEGLWQERAQERARLAQIFGVPITDLLDVETLVRHYLDRFAPPPVAPSCHACVFLREDTYRPGGKICWEARPPGQRVPVRLTTFEACAHFVPRGGTAPRQRCLAWLEDVHGIRYSAQRWQGHAHDLARAAGTWGFTVGQTYEARVRQWLATRYGPAFFLPHRWLVARDRHGVEHWREVDGIERWDATTAFVYEIKHRTPAYPQLLGEYVPLLAMAFPHVRVAPLEINLRDLYSGRRPEAEDAPAIAVLPALEHRNPDLGYQLFVLEV